VLGFMAGFVLRHAKNLIRLGKFHTNFMISWANSTKATAAERAKRALAGVLWRRSRLWLGLVLGFMAGFVLGHAKHLCTCMKLSYSTPKCLFKAAAITVSNDALPYSLDDVMNTLVLHHKITNSKEVNNFPN